MSSSARNRLAALPSRVAILSVHTSPLDQPGTGDAGGLNVYVAEVSKYLALAGVGVDIFTRATGTGRPPTAELAPGVTVRHLDAGPLGGMRKEELPAQLCGLTADLLRAEAMRQPGWYDLIHSHYWLSGHVGWVASERWDVPLVHSMHTMAKVKNATLAAADSPEPALRIVGEEQVVATADRLVANTAVERRDLVELYGADPARVAVVHPGVDLDLFAPGSNAAARSRHGLPADAKVLLFVGRIQPLKAPDVLLRAAAQLVRADPGLREDLVVVICGGPSGSGEADPDALMRLAYELGIGDFTRLVPPTTREGLADWYRAADLVCVPSHSESFGLVAVEAQACGTPVVAASVGGLRTTVADGVSGVLIDSHDPARWADVLAGFLQRPRLRAQLAAGTRRHAETFSWNTTGAALLEVYRDAIGARRLGQRDRDSA